MKDISRRGFLTAATVAAASAAVAGMAGCAPNGGAAAEGSSQEGGAGAQTRWSWETKPEPIPESDIAETIDTEICIVGFGATGAPAALAAAQGGAKVVVLQKESTVVTNGWSAAAFGSRRFLEAGQTYDLAEIYAQFAELANGRDNPRVVRLFLERSGEVMDYLLDQTPEQEPILLESGHTFGWFINNDMSTRYDQFKKLLENMAGKAEAAGAQVLYKTPAVQLVQDGDGAVTGVIGKRADGSYVQVNASKGVIMATGDLSDDEEMVECYTPLLKGVQNMHGLPTNTGDGFKMAMWAGASMDPAPHCIMMHFDPTWMPEGNAPYSGIPWLRVNLKGERFANENLGYQSVVTSVRIQPEQTAFQITDANWAVHAAVDDYKHPNSHSRHTTNPEADWQDAIDRGAIIQADTLEELADKCGIQKDTFLATVERYNELVDKGVDEDMGVRGDYLSWNAIKEPPFYALKRMPGVLATVGGLTVNERLEVLDTEGNVIPGLYAGGDASGSFYGNDYPLFITGGSLGRAFTFGVLAVRSALGVLDEPLDGLGA
ncbi:3-oxosteroid 1-dehydrogenase [Coriobacteriaceae bacterium CHKCI002]|nr:3-oxosteroid 1-dehydrogenase [Coriobacteriaceae bacterium CHKCI002]